MNSIFPPPRIKYDFFIAYPSVATKQSSELFDFLSDSFQVFLDSRELTGGQNWTTTIPKAQAASRMTIALICHEYLSAYYAQEEVASGIAFERAWGENRHRLVPIYLNGIPLDTVQVPYGLRCKQAFDVIKEGSLEAVAMKIKTLLGQSQEVLLLRSTPNQSKDSFEHPLKKYPTHPLVPAEWVSAELIQNYAQLIRQFEALQVIADTNRFRRESDPDDPDVTTIKEFQLLPVYSVPPYAFWLHAFAEARMHGPRMLAALLMVVPDEQFEMKARLNRRELLESLLISKNKS